MNVARVASGVILRAHGESHPGKVGDCPTCAEDWETVQRASGVTAPDC